MRYIIQDIKDSLEKITGLEVGFPRSNFKHFEVDLTIPCFKDDPKKIAEKINNLPKGYLQYIEKVKVEGKYVNIILDKATLAGKVFLEVMMWKEKYGHTDEGKGKTIIMEFSSPNIAKQLHIGHLRNTVLGNALANIYKACGFKVIRHNYLGDWGTSMATMILAWQKWGKGKMTVEKLQKLYVRVTKKISQEKERKKIKETYTDKLTRMEAEGTAAIMSVGRSKKRPLYITLTKNKVMETKEINDNLMVDYDKDGEIIGLELL